MSVAVEGLLDAHIMDDAQKATEAEHSMTLMQGLKAYPKAVGWSILLSTCIVMEGFDLVLINSLFGLPAFQKKFGFQTADGTYQVSAPWQTGLSNGALVGEILGLFVAGIVADKYGFKKTMIGALMMVTCFIFIVFFAQNITMLLVVWLSISTPMETPTNLTTGRDSHGSSLGKDFNTKSCFAHTNLLTGCFSNPDYDICCRSLSGCSCKSFGSNATSGANVLEACLPDHLRKSVLGVWPIPFLRRPQGCVRPYRCACIQTSICSSMDLACSSDDRYCSCARVSVVVGSQG